MYFFDSRIRYSEADSEGNLTLNALLNYFQDCSTFQSEDLGIGVGYLMERGQAWVLASWQIVVERFPHFGEKVEIGTIPYDLKGFLGYRNFYMKDDEGQYVAMANTMWILLDMTTGRPAAIDHAMLDRYELSERLPMNYAPRKIVVPAGGMEQEPVTVRPHHLDTNHHVNNGQYVAIAADYLPEGFAIRQLRAEYKKQAYLGDELYPYVAELADAEGVKGYVVALRDEAGSAYAVTEFQGVQTKEI